MERGQILLQARIVALSLFFGPVIYAAIVASFVERPVESAIAPQPLFFVWLAVAVVGVIVWHRLWQRVKTLTSSLDGRRRIQAGDVTPIQILRSMIIGWAALEAVSLVGTTMSLLTGRRDALVGGLLVLVVGIALSFPRTEWFAAFPRSASLPETD